MNKIKINKILLGLAVLSVVLNSCKNDDITFPDFDYQTVYFANQYPARTLELGEDLYVDTSIDNEYKVEIKATTGGVYMNSKDVVIDFRLDESLCSNLYFKESGKPVIPMPSFYYKLASNKITIPKNSLLGGVEVQLTDAFFEDPLSLTNTYVIPLVMTDVQGADSILLGTPTVDNPDRCIDADWTVKPRDYVLYAVKYVNPWHGVYLRRGVDQITGTAGASTSVRHSQNVEQDEPALITTNSLTKATLPLTIKDSGGHNVNFNLQLTFAADETCTVSGSTNEYEVSGSGKFVKKGEKNSIGGKDRNALYLDYTVIFNNLNLKYVTKDTLVVRDRAVSPEYFTVDRK